jgi:ribosomal protein S3
LKKAGEPSKEIDRAQATALTKTGIIGIKVAIMSPDAKIYDRIDIDSKMIEKINQEPVEEVEIEVEVTKKKKTRKTKKKVEKNEPKKDEPKKDKPNKEMTKKVEEKPSEDVGTEVLKESKVNPEEDGTAMEIEMEAEEGVSEEDLKAIEKVDEEKSSEEKSLEENKGEKK